MPLELPEPDALIVPATPFAPVAALVEKVAVLVDALALTFAWIAIAPPFDETLPPMLI